MCADHEPAAAPSVPALLQLAGKGLLALGEGERLESVLGPVHQRGERLALLPPGAADSRVEQLHRALERLGQTRTRPG